MDPRNDAAHPRGAVIFFFAILLTAVGLFGYLLWDFLTDVVLGLLIAGTCRPLYLRGIVQFKLRPWLAATLLTVLVAFCVAIPTVYLITALSQQAASAYDVIHDSFGSDTVQAALRGEGWFGSRAARLFELFGREYSPESLRAAASNTAGAIAGFLSKQLNQIVSNVLAAFYHFAMMLVVVYYGLLDGPTLKRRVFDLSPLPEEEEELIVQKFKDVGSAVLFGNGAASVLQGALGGLAMWAADLPSPVFWGTLIAIFAFLPLVGTNVVVVPATIYLLVIDRWAAGITFFVFTNVQGVFIDNVVKTKLMGDRMQMHNLLVFLSLLGGISAFGFAGLLYGPLAAAFFVTILELYERVYRVRLFARTAGG